MIFKYFQESLANPDMLRAKEKLSGLTTSQVYFQPNKSKSFSIDMQN